MSEAVQETVDDGRLRRIETRVTRMMMALGISPGHNYDLNAQSVMVDLKNREVLLPHLDVTLLDIANAIVEDGGDPRSGWHLVMRDQVLGTVTLAS